MARVVLLSLDGFPVRHLTRGIAPHLVELAERGAFAPAGGRAVIPSSSYPNLASLLTGARPELHGVTVPGRVPAPSAARTVRAATVIDRLAHAGIPSAAIVGDPTLHAVLRLDAASTGWPGPAPGSPVRRDAFGRLRDDETLLRILEAVEAGFPFVFGQLVEGETAGHVFGPDTPDALDAYRAADACVGAIVRALARDWDETTLIVVSDHDMMPAAHAPSIALAGDGIARVIADGGAAWVVPADGAAVLDVDHAVRATAGVVATLEIDGLVLALAAPGRQFAGVHPRLAGVHGGPDARATLAVVAGGSCHAAALGARIAAAPPPITVWARPILDRLLADTPAAAPVA